MTRKELRAKAREQLENNIFSGQWLNGLLVCLIVSLLVGTANSMVGLGILIAGPLTVGMKIAFLKRARGGEISIDDTFSAFKSDFVGTMLLGLLTEIFVLLWSLLFIIPGIIKALAYSMAYYIKADHPEYTWKQCLDESQTMMKGHKMDLFLLNLSFIGWILLGGLACGIGIFWVNPYMEAAQANFYLSIKGDDFSTKGDGTPDFEQPDQSFAPNTDGQNTTDQNDTDKNNNEYYI